MTELLIKGQVMKKAVCVLAVSLIVIFAGCQQSQEKQTAGISRKDRLLANENMNLKNELARCRDEIEKQKKLLEQCHQELNLKNKPPQCLNEVEKQKKLLQQCREEKEKINQQAEKEIRRDELVRQCEKEKEEIDQQAGENMKWVMDELPKDLLDDASKLSEENANLMAKIAELEKALEESNSQPQQK